MAAGLHPDPPLFSDGALHLAGVMARVAGWLPDVFWAATPADAAMVLGGWIDGTAGQPADRAALSALMEQFPDG